MIFNEELIKDINFGYIFKLLRGYLFDKEYFFT